jgi:hypothetical protein
VHDSKGRALYTGLTSLAEGADDPALARLYLDMRDLLFPEGLVIVTRSYAYEAGAIEALERRVTPELLAQLESIQIGPQTMAAWYRAWVAAGHELGRLVGQRESLLARTTRGGTGMVDVDLRAARGQWIGSVQTFLSALALMELAPRCARTCSACSRPRCSRPRAAARAAPTSPAATIPPPAIPTATCPAPATAICPRSTTSSLRPPRPTTS